MPLRPETTTFLQQLELYSNRKLAYAPDLGAILETARNSGQKQLFDDLIFQAKFVDKSFQVMKRIGIKGTGYDKLAAEFEASVKQCTAILTRLLDSMDEPQREQTTAAYLRQTQESLSRFICLLQELAIVKNWLLDGRTLP